MIAQIQGLQHFVANHLSDVVDWSKHVRPELERYPKQGDGKPQQSGDYAYILISTPFNRYRMSIASSYLDPPPGAPLACKSVGTVTFDDMADNKHIVGPKSDQTWTDISKHIHVRELTDALAAARREAAEATVETAGPARVKLAELAERANKWGVAAKVPEAATLAAGDSLGVEHIIKAQDVLRSQPDPAFDAPVHSIGPPVVASRDAPWLGAPVVFITNPGEQISGMQEIVGWCVKVYSHDRISLFMTPDHSEPSYRDNLPRRGSPAGNGRVHQFNCWDFNAKFMAMLKPQDDDALLTSPESIKALGKIIGDLQTEMEELKGYLETIKDPGNNCRRDLTKLEYAMGALQGRIIALETKRGPGRPPNPKPEGSEAA